jgi:CHAD domain-containing protein
LEASQRKETIFLEEIPFHFINYFDLILDKEMTGSKKDQEDIHQLRKIRGED